jgi:hypothetical protein
MASINGKPKYEDNTSLRSMLQNTSSNLEKHDFLSTVSMLDDVAEQQALRIIIQKNTALAKKTIWQYIIMSSGLQYSEQIKMLLKNGLPETKIEEAEGWKRVSAIFSYLADSTEVIQLLFYLDDFEAIKRGLIPLPLTQKAQIVAKALKYLSVSIPSLDATGRALGRLVGLGFLMERAVTGKHADKLYYTNPDLYLLWEKQKNEIDKKSNKTEVEKFWFK